jgi:hypothetical protein
MKSHAPLCLFIQGPIWSVASIVARRPCSSPRAQCFEWKAGPPSSLPSSALSSASRSRSSEQQRFNCQTVASEPIFSFSNDRATSKRDNPMGATLDHCPLRLKQLTFRNYFHLAEASLWGDADKLRHLHLTTCVTQPRAAYPKTVAHSRSLLPDCCSVTRSQCDLTNFAIEPPHPLAPSRSRPR